MRKKLNRRFRSEKAQTMTLFAILMPLLAVVLGLVVDLGNVYSQQRQAENAADAAALAAVRVLVTQGETAAINAGQYYSSLNGFSADVHTPPTDGPRAGEVNYVQVNVSRQIEPIFLRVFWNGSFHVHARAVAGYLYQAGGGGVITLNKSWTSFTLNGNIHFNVLDNGVVHVNSSSQQAMILNGNVQFNYHVAPTIVGNYTCNGMVTVNGQQCSWWGGASGLFITGAPVEPDPLAHVPQPTFTQCDHTWYSVNGFGTYYLDPGVYCGGITLNGSIKAIFRPGVYILAGGGLTVNGNYDIEGSRVMFFVTSWNGIPGMFTLNGYGYTHFTPPTSGPWKDIVFFQDRSNPYSVVINGNSNLSGFEGIIYAAAGSLIINGNATVHASYVVNKLTINGNANVNINSYFSSQIQGTPQIFLGE